MKIKKHEGFLQSLQRIPINSKLKRGLYGIWFNIAPVLEMFFEESKILRYSRKLTMHVDNTKLARILQILGFYTH